MDTYLSWFLANYTEWATKNRPPTRQLIMSSKSNVHLKWICLLYTSDAADE